VLVKSVPATHDGSGNHQIDYECHTIGHYRGRDEYHKASRHPLGDVHIVKPTLDEEGGDKERDGGDYDAYHLPSIAKAATAPIWSLQLIAGFRAARC